MSGEEVHIPAPDLTRSAYALSHVRVLRVCGSRCSGMCAIEVKRQNMPGRGYRWIWAQAAADIERGGETPRPTRALS